MKIILTGAGGFIGSCMIWQLNKMGIDDIVVVDTERDPSVYRYLLHKKIKNYLTREDLVRVLNSGQYKEIDALIHLGATTDTTEMNRDLLNSNNFEYSKKLATWALVNNKHFYYASSAAVYGAGEFGYSDIDIDVFRYKALNPYAESKLAFDRWVNREKLITKVTGFRYFNVFGPNEDHKGEMRSMVCKAFNQIKKTGTAQLFATTRLEHPNGSEARDFIYVKDVTTIMGHFLEHTDQKGIYNIGTGQARTFKDLVDAVFTAFGKPSNITYIPMPDKLRGKYQYFTEAKIDSLKFAGYDKPFTSLEDAVKDYVQNYLVMNWNL